MKQTVLMFTLLLLVSSCSSGERNTVDLNGHLPKVGDAVVAHTWNEKTLSNKVSEELYALLREQVLTFHAISRDVRMADTPGGQEVMMELAPSCCFGFRYAEHTVSVELYSFDKQHEAVQVVLQKSSRKTYFRSDSKGLLSALKAVEGIK